MIEATFIKKMAARYQTTTENIAREYFQNLFLSALYQKKGSEKLFFKGGTALRIIWRSPRFSEDLDFTGSGISISKIENLMEETLLQLEQEGINTTIEESKTTSGGYLAILHLKSGSEYKSNIQIEISLRSGKKNSGTTSLINSELIPPYMLMHLEENQLVEEKIQACLTRAKARDFYDLYFILRSRLAFHEFFSKKKDIKGKILIAIKSQHINFSKELKTFLPITQHSIIKDFKETLLREIERNLP